MAQDIFTLSIDNKILLTTSDSVEARKKITELKNEGTPSFTFKNTTENLTFQYTKKYSGTGYWTNRVPYGQQRELPTQKNINL